MLAGDALADSEFPLIAGSATAGIFSPLSRPRRAPAAGPIVEKFRAKNIDPDGCTLYTYAAIQVWAQAATGAGSVDGRTVAGVLKSCSFNTVLGPRSFTAKGDITQLDYVVYGWKNDRHYLELPSSR